MARYKLIVLSNPLPGRDKEFNEWYDTVHVPDAMSLAGVMSGRRFRIAQNKPWKYMAEYEIECDDIDKWEAQSNELQKKIGVPDAFDFSSVISFFVEPLKSVP